MSEHETRWLLSAIPDMDGLKIFVTVDTISPAVLTAIEEAARVNGIHLTRLSGDAEAG